MHFNKHVEIKRTIQNWQRFFFLALTVYLVLFLPPPSKGQNGRNMQTPPRPTPPTCPPTPPLLSVYYFWSGLGVRICTTYSTASPSVRTPGLKSVCPHETYVPPHRRSGSAPPRLLGRLSRRAKRRGEVKESGGEERSVCLFWAVSQQPDSDRSSSVQ